MATWVWVLIAVAVVVLIVVGLFIAVSAGRTTRLRKQFGPEYERTMQDRDGRRAAESDLRNRQKQREQLNIHPLAEPARARYAEQWRELQERFIDQPASAVMEADVLVRQVMNDEGYPVDDFNRQADSSRSTTPASSRTTASRTPSASGRRRKKPRPRTCAPRC